MTVAQFLTAGGIPLILPLALLPWPLSRLAGPSVAGGVAAGSALAALSALVWLGCLRWSWGRGQRAFLGSLCGGILARLAVLLAATAWAVWARAVHLPSFVGSLFVFYVWFQFLEVRLVRGFRMPSAASDAGPAGE